MLICSIYRWQTILFTLIGLVFFVGMAIAQEHASSPSSSFWAKILNALLDVLPVMMGPLGAYITKGANWLVGKMGAVIPKPLLAVLSLFFGAFSAALTAQMTGSPLPTELINGAGAIGGGIGHAQIQTRPIETDRPNEPATNG